MRKSIVFFCVGVVIAGTLEATFAPGGPAPGRQGQLQERKRQHQGRQNTKGQGQPSVPQEKKLEKTYQVSSQEKLNQFINEYVFRPVVVKFYNFAEPDPIYKEVASMYGQQDSLSGVGGWQPSIKVNSWIPGVRFVMAARNVMLPTARKYNVKIFPTYLFFSKGKEVEKLRHSGKITKEELVRKVNALKKHSGIS